MTEKVKAIIMLEILGKPADHVVKILKEIVSKISEQKDVEVLGKKIADAKQVEDKDAFTSFAEVEVETSLEQLIFLVFSFMPSHVEIISPEELKIKSFDLTNLLTELLKKLHQYDEIARTVLIERQILAKQIKEGKIKLRLEDSTPKKTKKPSKKKKNLKKKN